MCSYFVQQWCNIDLYSVLLQFVRKRKTYFAHDEESECRVGDLVMIKECRPISKQKNFKVIDILERTESYTHPVSGEIYYKEIK